MYHKPEIMAMQSRANLYCADGSGAGLGGTWPGYLYGCDAGNALLGSNHAACTNGNANPNGKTNYKFQLCADGGAITTACSLAGGDPGTSTSIIVGSCGRGSGT